MTQETNDWELLSMAVTAMDLMYGVLEKLRDTLAKDDAVKWNRTIGRIDRALKKADQARRELMV